MAQYTNRMVKKMRTDEVICELIEVGADMVTNHGVTVTYFPQNTQHPAHLRSYEAVIAVMPVTFRVFLSTLVTCAPIHPVNLASAASPT